MKGAHLRQHSIIAITFRSTDDYLISEAGNDREKKAAGRAFCDNVPLMAVPEGSVVIIKGCPFRSFIDSIAAWLSGKADWLKVSKRGRTLRVIGQQRNGIISKET